MKRQQAPGSGEYRIAGGVTTDDPHWRRGAAISASLAVAAAVAATQVGGYARTACILAAIVVGLPALSTAAFALLGSLLSAFDVPSSPEEDRRGGGRPQLQRNRARLFAVVLAVLLGAVGATWYALAPGVGSYQLSILLILPAVAVALIWLHHRMAHRLQWAVALAIAPIGPIGYLIVGGAQWWNWGQLTVLPLVLLVAGATRATASGQRGGFGGLRDGPWGPP